MNNYILRLDSFFANNFSQRVQIAGTHRPLWSSLFLVIYSVVLYFAWSQFIWPDFIWTFNEGTTAKGLCVTYLVALIQVSINFWLLLAVRIIMPLKPYYLLRLKKFAVWYFFFAFLCLFYATGIFYDSVKDSFLAYVPTILLIPVWLITVMFILKKEFDCNTL